MKWMWFILAAIVLLVMCDDDGPTRAERCAERGMKPSTNPYVMCE
ncbi:hypothetical protein [Ruegeria sp. HKCCD9179]|nr:hypothetical protein [Ruegeria sp. HKCCD9179]